MKSSDGASTQTKQDQDYVPKELERAWDYVYGEQFDDAYEAYSGVLRLDPANSEALYGQALCLRKLGNKEAAQSKLKDVIELDPSYARFLEKEALQYLDKKQYDKAIEPFVEASDKEALQRMIVSFRTLRPLKEVEAIIGAALRQFPDDPGFRSEPGWWYYTHEHYDKAIEAFDEVLKDTSRFREGALVDPTTLTVKLRDSRDSVSQYLRARFTRNTQILIEKYDGSRPLPESLQKALIDELDELLRGPSLFDEKRFAQVKLREETRRLIAQNLQGEDLVRLNRLLLEDAYPHEIAKSLKAGKGYETTIQGKIASLRLKRNFSKAYELLQDSIERFPEHYGIQSELGWLYFDQIQYHKALEVFQKNYNNNKGDSAALQWIISCLRKQRNFAEAQKWIEKAPADGPTAIGILIERGWLHFDKKHYAEALMAFDEALRTDERHEFALQGKIASLRLQRRFPEAEECIKKALGWHSTSTGVLSERGWLHFDQQEYIEADESFEEAIGLAPNRIDLTFGRVSVLSRMNRSFEAEEILKELKLKFPGYIEVMEQIGRFYVHQRDLDSAEEEFKSILRKDANNISGLGGLGAVYLLQARYEEAIEKFRKVLQLDKYNPAWYANLAWALVRHEGGIRYRQRASKQALGTVKGVFGIRTQENPALSLLEEAEELCQKALELDSESAEAYGCLGTIAFKRGKLRFSEDYLLSSIKKDPQKGNYVGLGALYVQMGRYDAAEKNLREALRRQDDVPAHVELGNLYLKTGKTMEAIQEFRQAMAIDPDDDDPPRALAIALMQVNQLTEAETLLRDALRRLDESKRWRLHLTHSQLLTKRGDETEYSHYYNEAFKEAKKAIKLKPNHADPYFQAGFIRAKLKDYKGARKYFRSSLNQDAHHDEAESNLTHVQSLIREEKERTRSSFWAGFCVGALAVSQLILLWYFFKQGRVTETILSVLLPILLGLVVVAFLMPVLYKLKLPGLEAELRERKEPVSSEPKGEVVFSSSPPTISSGPH